MGRRSYPWIFVKRGKRNAVARRCLWIAFRKRRSRTEFIYNRRAADATEASEDTGRGFVERHQIFALYLFEIADLDTGTAAKRGSVLFAAHRAMAVARCHKRALDLELDATA